MNIIKLNSDNLGGLKHLLAIDVSRVVAGAEKPEGINVNEGICHYSDSPWQYLKGVRETMGFVEEEEIIDGVSFYKQSAVIIIPKDCPEIMNQFLNWDKKRFIVLAPDNNGYIKLMGTRKEPCRFIKDIRDTKVNYDGRNEIVCGFYVSRKEPAYNYTVQYAQVQTVGTHQITKPVYQT